MYATAIPPTQKRGWGLNNLSSKRMFCATLSFFRVKWTVTMEISLQMFIGEMGCWLVVLGCNLWNQHIGHRFGASSEASPLAGGYEPVDGADDDLAESDDELDSNSPLNGSPRASTTKLSPMDHDDRIKLEGWKVFLLAAPACCDITGTTLMNVGLLFVVASIYQMTRGALVLFVGLFSVLFLRRKLYLYQWLALFAVVLGVGVVGLAGAIFKDKHEVLDGVNQTVVQLFSRAAQDEDAAETPVAVQTVIGVLLIAGAQIFTATQFVLEEWILEHYAMNPLKVVGWEGIFGFLVTLVGMIILHLTIGNTESGKHGYFDAREGWHNMTTNRAVAISSVLIMISIGYVNPTHLFILILTSPTTLKIIIDITQWLQLFWPQCHPIRVCHLSQHHRHVPHPLHLDDIPWPGLGVLQVASGSWLCYACLRHFPFQ